jgi:uncharacterized repeat protein (TIGR02543 family)
MYSSKKLKKKIILLLFIITIITSCLFYNYKNNSNKEYIDKVLSTSSYSYLSKDVKKIIKDIYEETGEVILTEKNKVTKEPYLNPDYISYIDMSDIEKSKVEVIPEMYIIDYDTLETTENIDASYPTKYDLRDYNGNSYITPLKNQENTGLCWAFTTTEVAETKAMLMNNTPYTSEEQRFSVRQLDYALSYDGLTVLDKISNKTKVFTNPNNAARGLTTGGTFTTATYAMANGLATAKESVLPWSQSTDTYDVSQILNYSNSQYEVNNTIEIPVISSNTADSDTIDTFVNKVKSYISKYGAAYVGTVSPQSDCGFRNTDGTYVIESNSCYSTAVSTAHAMQIIGWDDDYEYSYCSNDSKNSASSNGSCSSGTLVSGKGAWIIRNSWGDTTIYKYIHITYNSTRLNIGVIKDMSSMSERTWDNNYHTSYVLNPESGHSYSISTDNTQTFETKNDGLEKIEKIKFFSYTENSKYTIKITTSDKKYTISSLSVTNKGINSFDLSSRNIYINGSSFSVEVIASTGRFIVKSISVFTTNIDKDEKSITYSNNGYNKEKSLSKENPLFLDASSKDWSFTLTSYLKNITDYSDITYKINYNGTSIPIIESEKYSYSNYQETTFLGTNLTSSDFDIKELYGKTFNINVYYNDNIIETFPVKLRGDGKSTQSTVRFYANNETNNYYEIKVNDLETINLKNTNLNNKNFYNDGYYIIAWNEECDLSGTSYDLEDTVIYKDLNLYAEWTDKKIEIDLNFICDNKTTCNGEVQSLTTKIGDSITLPINEFTRTDNYGFLYWQLNDKNYYEEESVILTPTLLNYPIFNNTSIDVYSIWSNNYKTISFDSNNGTGTMKSINVEIYNKDGSLKENILKPNFFTRIGYKFYRWNTSPTGNGTYYYETNSITTKEDITLYAEWERVTHKITFNSNYSNNSIEYQTINDLEETTLNKNIFVREGYTFKEWNTSSSGNGSSYKDQNTIALDKDLELFAIWEINQYTITFNTNNGLGSLSDIVGNYDTKVTLPSNPFTREGYTFKEWNTSSEGDGESYFEGDNITIKSDLKLYAIWTKNDPIKIITYTFNNQNKYITNIPENTSLSKFKNNIIIENNYTVEIDTKKQNNIEVIYTGSKTKVYYNKNLELEVLNIVLGDNNGDGVINSADLLKIRQHLLSVNKLSNEYFIASDIDNNNTINSLDLLRIRQHLLGTRKIN